MEELKSLFFTPEAVLVIGTFDENGVPNAMNAAWGIQSDYHEITVFLGSHKTTDNLKLKGECTIAFATRSTVKAADYFGVETGRNVNKIEKAGIGWKKADDVDAPAFEGFPVVLECRVKNLNEDYTLTAEVVKTLADPSVLTDGKIDLKKLDPVFFDVSSSQYFTVGEAAGKAFSMGLELKK